MSSQIIPSDSYKKYLSLPSLQPAPKHIRSLLPDYEITHILGVGGYAKVYKAIGPRGKEVALKIPKTDDIMATIDMEVIERFRNPNFRYDWSIPISSLSSAEKQGHCFG